LLGTTPNRFTVAPCIPVTHQFAANAQPARFASTTASFATSLMLGATPHRFAAAPHCFGIYRTASRPRHISAAQYFATTSH
jgi:hypothetical protein